MTHRSILVVLPMVALFAVGCDDRPDMSGTYAHPVTGELRVGDDSQALSGPWSVEVTRGDGHTYQVTFQGCTLRTEEQVHGVAHLVSDQECTVELPGGVRATLQHVSGQIDHRTDLGINLSFQATGETVGDEPRPVDLRPLFPASP